MLFPCVLWQYRPLATIRRQSNNVGVTLGLSTDYRHVLAEAAGVTFSEM
jgi:hypothetical protein